MSHFNKWMNWRIGWLKTQQIIKENSSIASGDNKKDWKNPTFPRFVRTKGVSDYSLLCFQIWYVRFSIFEFTLLPDIDGVLIFEFGNLSTPTAKNSSLSTWFLFSFPTSSKDKLKNEFLRHICTVRYVWDDLIRNSKSSLPIFQIMLDELEEELLLLDEVNRKENFTFMDNVTMEENSNHTGIQVTCR